MEEADAHYQLCNPSERQLQIRQFYASFRYELEPQMEYLGHYNQQLMYDEDSDIQGRFLPTPNSKCTEDVGVNGLVVNVDSTIGFGATGTFKVGSNTISYTCLLYTSPSPRDLSTSRMPSSA